MALIACSECGNQISDKAASCPRCGAINARIRNLGRNRRRRLLVLLGLGVIVCLFGVVMLAAGHSLAVAHNNQAIVDQQFKSLGSCTDWQCFNDTAESAANIPTSDSDGHVQSLIGVVLVPVGGLSAIYALIALAVSRGVRSA